MEKNLSGKIMVTRGTQGNVNENSTKTNNIKSKRAPETKLGKLYEELVIAKHGEEEAKRLLDRDTMNDTIRNMVEKIDVNDPKNEEKKQEIREILKLVMVHDQAFNIEEYANKSTKFKKSKKSENVENSFEELCNVGIVAIYNTVNRLPIEYDEETQKMCIWTIGNPKKSDSIRSLNEDCTVIENLHNYLADSVKKIDTYVKKNISKGLDDIQGIIQREIRKSEEQCVVHFYTRREKTDYLVSQINKILTEEEERTGKKQVRVTLIEVEEVMCYGTSEKSVYDTSLNSDDSRELIETLELGETEFEDNLVGLMDMKKMGADMNTIMATIVKSLQDQAVKSVEDGKSEESVEDTTRLNYALYYVSEIKGNEELLYYMKEAVPKFEDIIKEYGKTYTEIAKYRNRTTEAMRQQGDTKKKNVNKELRPIYEELKSYWKRLEENNDQ